MTSLATVLTPDLLAMAAARIRHRRANDPWSGPKGTARPEQLPPDGDWSVWLYMAGRGAGKTRTAAEYIRQAVQRGQMRRVFLVGATAADARDVMIEGESGLLACCERAGFGARYNPSNRKVTFANGALAFAFSADVPGRLRGPQNDGYWADELAAWRYVDAWDQLQFGTRLGTHPRGVVTTTPRPIRLVKDLLARETSGEVAVTRGTTYQNRANLAPSFYTQVIRRYEGTALGRQELMGELVEDVEGALWVRRSIDAHRVLFADNGRPLMPAQSRVVIAVDPATTYGEGSDATGLAAVGRGVDGDFYPMHIAGVRLPPHQWAREALRLYDLYEADAIVAESNQGGEMVRETILAALPKGQIRPRIELVHASRGKRVRAEPVAALYEQGRVHHVGTFASAEDQMCAFPIATDHDDEVDALVHAVAALIDAPAARARSF